MSITSSIEGLDWPLMEKIARNELDLMSRPFLGSNRAALTPEEHACSVALSKAHLSAYLDAHADVAVQVARWAMSAHDADPALDARVPLTDEFVVGHALAVTALKHGVDDTVSVLFGKERALDLADSLNLMANIGEVTPDRMVGVDMTRPIQSRQTCTPLEVMDRAEEIELEDGRVAADALTFADCEEIAQGLMDSFGGVDLDYADLEDVDLRVLDKAAAREGKEPVDIKPPLPLNVQAATAQRAAQGQEQHPSGPATWSH